MAGDYEHKPNRGALFKNDYKEKGDKRPDSKGDGLCECPHCHEQWKVDIAGWWEKTAEGTKWLSLAFKPDTYKPDEHANPPGGEPPDERGADGTDDSIPF